MLSTKFTAASQTPRRYPSVWRGGTPRIRCRAGQQPECIGQLPSGYNPHVTVWQFPDSPEFPDEIRKAKGLMLDFSGNIHSLYREGKVLTGAYWDCLAVLPALVPEGPLSILGLAAGTIAHIVHAYYPQRVMHGWELDPAVVELAQQHMGMQQLTDAGCLVVHVGDALVETATVPGGAAGVIVDLFANGQLIPQLTQVETWRSIRQKLASNGRLITNLGEAPAPGNYGRPVSPGVMTTRAALAAMAEAFDGQVTYCSLVHGNTANMVVISGPPITDEEWSRVPADLAEYTQCSWKAWQATER